MNAVMYALWLIKEIFVAGISLALAAFKQDNDDQPVKMRYRLRDRTQRASFWIN